VWFAAASTNAALRKENEMSVITGSYDDMFGVVDGRKRKCAHCKETIYHYPFLHWHDDIVICGKCCCKIKDGFTADLIQTAAIVEFQAVGYEDYTFVRKSIKQLERENLRQKELEAEAYDKVTKIK
jgi:hypothetical protein